MALNWHRILSSEGATPFFSEFVFVTTLIVRSHQEVSGFEVRLYSSLNLI